MASTDVKTIPQDELLEQFESITGCQGSVAKHFLEACKWDLEMAIGMHMDSGGTLPTQERPKSGTKRKLKDDDVDVRAPIPQKHETLIEENHSFGQSEDKKGVRGGRRRGARSVFDGFRDFQAEARQLELVTAGQEPSTSSSSSSSASKKKTLEDLFRPPLDLLQKGSFMTARNRGTSVDKWLLINVQNVQEFACQVLNRDVWSHIAVKEMIKAHFIFWQVYSDSEEGKKYMQFYKVKKWPYIAVLDPRTGENVVQWDNIDSLTFCDLVSEFVAGHPSPSGCSKDSPPSKRAKIKDSIVDASEDSQMEAAIQASLKASEHCTVPPKDAESDSQHTDAELETFTDSDDDSCKFGDKISPKKKEVCAGSPEITDSNSQPIDDVTLPQLSPKFDLTENVSSQNSDCTQENGMAAVNENAEQSPKTLPSECTWKQYIGKDTDPTANLSIRFPDGQRELLKIPCSSKLRAIVLFAVEKGYSNERYELVTNYPKRKLSYLDFDATLKELGLFPQETIFIQER